MSIRKKLTGAILSLALLATLGVTAYAQETSADKMAPVSKAGKMHRRGRGHHGMPLLRLMHGLNLTDAQKDQARTIVERFRTSIQPQRQALMELHKQRAQGGDSEAIKAKAMTLRGEIRTTRKSAHTELLTILTPEQRAQYDQMELKMKARREERRARRGARRAQEKAPADAPAQ